MLFRSYFVSTRLFTDLKWGTQNPVIVRDPEFGMVRLRAFGAYAARVVEPKTLVTEVAGTDPQFRTEEIGEYLRQSIIGQIAGVLGSTGLSVLDLAAQQVPLATRMAATMTTEFAQYGIEVPKFIIENISLPPEVEAAVDKRSQIGIVGDLNAYTQLATANAIGDAARNPGGGASEGVGLGLGMAVGQRMAASVGQPAAPPASAPPAGPPPLPTQAQWYIGVGGEQQGPYDLAGLRGQVASGALSATTLVWSTGMSGWTAASDVPQVAALLAAIPPPLPPQS